MKKYRVYRLKDINNEVLYVGYTSKTALERFEEHARDKYWINKVASIDECVTTSESQARINEIYWINKIKPIFNAKDKFPGAIDIKLNERDTKFTHVSYVFNGAATNCIINIGEDYTLIDTLSIHGIETKIGVYMDKYLNVWISASDLCQAVGLKRKRPMNFAKNKHVYERAKYTLIERGTKKEYTTYLCNYDGALMLLNSIKDSYVANTIKEMVKTLYCVADLRYMCKDEASVMYNKHILNMAFEEGLSDDNFNNSTVKRRLAYTIILNGMQDMDDTIDSYSDNLEVFDLRFNAELIASEVFAMAEDIINEYGISYKDVFSSFNDYLMSNYNIAFWKERAHYNKVYDTRFQPHFIVAIDKVNMYVPFINFYENELSKRAC